MIKHILFAQPVFAPDQMRLERNINSLQSLGQYLKENGTDSINMSVVLGGWAKTDELWNEIVKACHEHISPQMTPVRFDKNYGKAHVLNSLVNHALQQQPTISAIISADSDILFPLETPHMFLRMAIVAEQMVGIKKKNWGLIGFNQLGHGCHFKSCWDNQAKYIATIKNQQFPELIVWPSIPSGIAGGCLFLNADLWKQVGGYKNKSVYGPDDAYMLHFCDALGYSYQVADTIGIVHPPENDQQYQEWKVRVCQRVARNPNEDFNALVNEAEDFWKDRK
jgi:hypothetical protein